MKNSAQLNNDQTSSGGKLPKIGRRSFLAAAATATAAAATSTAFGREYGPHAPPVR